jgi:hypothetical protein
MMTIAETQALLTTIHGHIDGRSGDILSVSVRDGVARVIVSWEAFVSAFGGTAADDKVPGLDSTVWRKAVGVVTYVASQPTPGAGDTTVPASP